MDLSSIWPTWGSQGDKPLDGKDYEQGDNVDAGSLDYLWYHIKDAFEKVETALSNKADDPHGNESHSENYITSGEVDGGAPDPHGNSSHSTNFLPSNNYNPLSDVEDETSPLNIDITGDADTLDGQDASAFADSTHGNEAHSEDYITSGQVDGGAPDPHGNASHSTNFLAASNYSPATDVESVTTPLNIDIRGDADTVDGKDASQLGGNVSNPHGNEAHTEDYITSGQVDGGAPDPHGNSSHSTNFFPQANYNPVNDVEAETSALNIDITGDADTVDGQDASAFADSTHGNSAHSSTFAVDGDAQPPENHGNSAHSSTFAVDGDAQPPENHGNGAHSTNFLPSSNYNPVNDVEAETSALNIDITGDADTLDGQDASAFADSTHGNGAHSTNFLPSSNYNPVSDVEAETSALNIDITGDADTVDGQDASAFADSTHGNGAHSNNYLHTLTDSDTTDTSASTLQFGRQLELLPASGDEDVVSLTLNTKPEFSTAPLLTEDFINFNENLNFDSGDNQVDVTDDLDSITGINGDGILSGIRFTVGSNTKVAITDSSGNQVATIDENGDMEIAGSLTENANL